MKRLLAFLIVIAVTFGVIAFTAPGLLQGTKLGLDLKGGFEILYEAEPLYPGGTITPAALKQTALSLEKRANQNNVGEPEVTTEGSNRIRVKIAGVADETKLRELMKRPANLEFRSADGCASPTDFCTVELMGSEFVEGAAKVQLNEFGEPVVAIQVKDKNKLAEVSTRLVRKQLAIVLDGEIISAPVVDEPLRDGHAIIRGQRSLEEARELADIINMGALPLKLTEKYTQSVGATLGMKSLQQTLLAGVVASVLIMIFLVAYYRLPGFVASICVLFYVWLLLSVLWLMDATITLPGIAAFVLGVGIAVDSNILMAERMKDELRNGKSLYSAFRAGSKNSFRAIIDAHATNVIAGASLYFMGHGAVRGFAIVHLWSIVINILTNVFFPRLLLSLLILSGKFSRLGYYGVKESEVRAL